ncbi:unnamed protein product, partial [Polarella glacialis]
ALETALAAQGLLNINVAGDGSCQFHAICLAGTLEIDAGELRKQVVQYLEINEARFAGFVTGAWSQYLASMALSTTWGDHVTLMAAAELLGRPILFHSVVPDGELVVVPTIGDPDAAEIPEPIQLAFEHELRYQAVVAGVENLPEQGPVEDDGITCCHCGWALMSSGCLNPDCETNTNSVPQAAGAPETLLPASTDSKGMRTCSLCGGTGRYIQSCPKRVASLKKQGPRGSSMPEEWSNYYSYGPEGGQLPSKTGNNFRAIVQKSLVAISKLTEQEAEADEGVKAGKAVARRRRRTKTKDDVEAGKDDAAES